MSKQILFLLVLGVLLGGVYFFLNYEIQREVVAGRPAGWKIVPKAGGPVRTPGGESAVPPVAPMFRPTVRIATFQLGRLDETKLSNRNVFDVLTRLFPRFDLMAIQGVRGRNRGALIRLIERVNATSGRSYDFATCPTQQRDALEHYSAFIFDRARFDVDRNTVRFVEDSLDRFRIKPLVGSFRVRGPDPSEAFTFTLINVEVDEEQIGVELNLLAEAFRAVLNDGRNEDDVILLGDLKTGDRDLGGLGGLLGVTPLLSERDNAFTTTRGVRLLDNILLDRRATVEFAGLVGVMDVIREFELTMPSALEVSERLPVWAEFSAYECGQPGMTGGPVAVGLPSDITAEDAITR